MTNYDEETLANLQKRMRARFGRWNTYKRNYRKYHFWISAALLLVSSLNAVVVGMSNSQGAAEFWSIAAMVMAGVILFANGMQSLINAGDMYSHNAKALNLLIDIQIRLKKDVQNESLTDNNLQAYEVEFRELEKNFFDDVSDLPSLN